VYEVRSRDIQKRRAELRKPGRPGAAIEALFAVESRVVERLLGGEAYAGKVGAVEGAMYETRGYYRPAVNSFIVIGTAFFSAVCRRAIGRVSDQYTGGEAK